MPEFFPYDNTLYNGEDFRRYTAPRSSGVYSAEDHFEISTAGNTVTIGTGQAWMKFDKLRGGQFSIIEPETYTVPDITAGQVARLFFGVDVYLNTKWAEFRVGTNANDPAIQPTQNNVVMELAPYEVTIADGLYRITDNRLDEALCGVMRDEVTGIPTQQLLDRANQQMDAIDERFDSLDAGKSPYVNDGGTWAQYDDEGKQWVDTGRRAEGAKGEDGEAGLPALTYDGIYTFSVEPQIGDQWLFDPETPYAGFSRTPVAGDIYMVILGLSGTARSWVSLFQVDAGRGSATCVQFKETTGAKGNKGDKGDPGVGDMQSPDYDPGGAVKSAGGIPAYVSGAVDVLAILRAVYPVGSIYMNYMPTDPATLLGFGTWERIARGQMIVGVNEYDAAFNAAGKTGGSKTHSHTLGGGYALLESASSTTYVQRKEDVASWQSGRQFSASASSTTGSRTAGTTLGGSTDSASNMPPYYTVYIWRRTA